MVANKHQPIGWDAAESCARDLVRLALSEDLESGKDVTTHALVPRDRQGAARVVAREAGVVCGLPVGELIREEFNACFAWRPQREDGDLLVAGDCVATLAGPAHELLTCERTLLNFLGRLSGVATLTHRYAQAIEGSTAHVYDTRKTTPGWRRLEKYAVACGGGMNHRLGLHDAVLIKDNHLALAAEHGVSLAEAVEKARTQSPPNVVLQVEVDTLQQLQQALNVKPDIVLLDNMTCDQLRTAVEHRDSTANEVQLEASGGVTLATIAEIAATGVDRISVGALTHSARSLDLGLDWQQA